jgi:Ca2+-binding RTX toxin-like protein
MAGGAGNDTYNNVDSGDTITELLNEGYDTVNTALNSFTLAANVDRVNFSGSGNFTATGNAIANRFQGAGGDDRFVDVLGGADIFSDGLGSDALDFRTGATGAVLNFATSTHSGAAAGDAYSSIEKFFGSNTAADTMTAGTGKADFSGFGGKGDDTMTGGTGKDLFVYVETAASGGWSADTVTDFEDGKDRIKIDSPGVASAITDFNIAGNGTASVLLTLNALPSSTINLNAASAITITAGDFLFY